ncbi:MAG: Diaminopimelate epimerase, partial [Gammaproteobacteria bacterium]|nr:Diaminopimelate epimerase [Gammaproteobacteria bacterium]
AYLETSAWTEQVRELTDRECGIGADGLIVMLRNSTSPHIQALFYNQDGSYSGFCGNGSRCVAHYLHENCHFPKSFKINMGSRLVECHFEELVKGKPGITTLTPKAEYLGTRTLSVADKQFTAHVIDVGNPHLVIFEQVQLDWLKKYGKDLEFYFGQDHRYNVEFIWQSGKDFHMLVHERGVGITKACGSGAMATAVALVETGQLAAMQKITVQMQGGAAIAWLNANHQIALHADAEPVALLNHDKTQQVVLNLGN